MPITQQRMLSIIKAARDYQQALTRAESFVNNSIDNINRGSSHKEELENLQWMIKATGLLNDPQISFAAIELENSHFLKRAPGNLRNAARMKMIREGIWEEKIETQKNPASARTQNHGTHSQRAPNHTAASGGTAPQTLAAVTPQNGTNALDEVMALVKKPKGKIDLSAPNVVDCEGDINFDEGIGGLAAVEGSAEHAALAAVDIDKPLNPGSKAFVDQLLEQMEKEEMPENKMKFDDTESKPK